MKKLIIILLALIALSATNIYAEGELTVVSKNVIEFEGEKTGYFFAKVENTSDKTITTGYGTFVGLSANGDKLVSSEFLGTYPSDIELKPGEYAYVSSYLWNDALEKDDIAEAQYSMRTSDYPTELICFPSEAEFSVADEYDSTVTVTIKNDSENALKNFYVMLALYDDADNIIFVGSAYYNFIVVHPKSTVSIKTYLGPSLVSYYNKNNIKAAKADAMVFVEGK